MSSSQLNFTHMFQRGRLQPPDEYPEVKAQKPLEQLAAEVGQAEAATIEGDFL